MCPWGRGTDRACNWPEVSGGGAAIWTPLSGPEPGATALPTLNYNRPSHYPSCSSVSCARADTLAGCSMSNLKSRPLCLAHSRGTMDRITGEMIHRWVIGCDDGDA